MSPRRLTSRRRLRWALGTRKKNLDSAKSMVNRIRDRVSAASFTLPRKSCAKVFKTVINLLGGIYLTACRAVGSQGFSCRALHMNVYHSLSHMVISNSDMPDEARSSERPRAIERTKVSVSPALGAKK